MANAVRKEVQNTFIVDGFGRRFGNLPTKVSERLLITRYLPRSPGNAGWPYEIMQLGRRINERFNVQKATDAACRYLRKLYDQLGSWSLVAAAYNVGPGFLKNQIKRHDNRDYYRMSLPREIR